MAFKVPLVLLQGGWILLWQLTPPPVTSTFSTARQHSDAKVGILLPKQNPVCLAISLLLIR